MRLRQGHLYAWGGGEYGQLGVGDEDDRQQPCLIEFKSLDSNDQGGQACVAYRRAVTSRPGVRIISACCGSYFTAAVTDDGHLYT
ncbi:MAG: RCC1-like domain-containing protein, partial [bacterium]